MRIALAVLTVAMLGVATHADTPTPETLFAEGQTAYDHADYATAIVKWQAAYDASREGDLFFNIGQAKRLAGDCTGALSAYRSFIAADPTSDRKPLAEDLARELEGKCGAKTKPTPTPTPTNESSQHVTPPDQGAELNLVQRVNDHKQRRSPGRPLKIAAASTGGASLVALAIGIGLGAHAQSLANEVSAACRTSCNWSQWKSKDAAGRNDASVGRALDVGSAIGMAGATALYYLGMRHHTITITPLYREGGAGVSWSRSW
jgi:hypothetical protein